MGCPCLAAGQMCPSAVFNFSRGELPHPEASRLSLPFSQVLNLSYALYANGNTQASPPQMQTDTGGQTCLTVSKGPGDLDKPLRCRGHYLKGPKQRQGRLRHPSQVRGI